MSSIEHVKLSTSWIRKTLSREIISYKLWHITIIFKYFINDDFVLYQKFTFLYFRTLICVKRLCGSCDGIYSSIIVYDDISRSAWNFFSLRILFRFICYINLYGIYKMLNIFLSSACMIIWRTNEKLLKLNEQNKVINYKEW